MIKQINTHNFELDLSSLNSGIYTLGYFENGNWRVESFVKE
jgi:hypothetical protein